MAMIIDDRSPKLREVFQEAFPFDPAQVSLSSQLATGLDLKDINTVKLAIELKDLRGCRIQAAAVQGLRTIRGVREIFYQPPQNSPKT